MKEGEGKGMLKFYRVFLIKYRTKNRSAFMLTRCNYSQFPFKGVFFLRQIRVAFLCSYLCCKNFNVCKINVALWRGLFSKLKAARVVHKDAQYGRRERERERRDLTIINIRARARPVCRRGRIPNIASI